MLIFSLEICLSFYFNLHAVRSVDAAYRYRLHTGVVCMCVGHDCVLPKRMNRSTELPFEADSCSLSEPRTVQTRCTLALPGEYE